LKNKYLDFIYNKLKKKTDLQRKEKTTTMESLQTIFNLCASRINETSCKNDDVIDLKEISSLIELINNKDIIQEFGYLIEEGAKLSSMLPNIRSNDFSKLLTQNKEWEELSRKIDMHARQISDLSDYIKYEKEMDSKPEAYLTEGSVPEFVNVPWAWFIWRSSLKLKQSLGVMKYINDKKKIKKYLFDGMLIACFIFCFTLILCYFNILLSKGKNIYDYPYSKM
tara:strand:- start:860 stop:1531 length:672 start_codon:yes stop_codon:yes gene_type:complete